MRPPRKIMMVETTHAFVKLKQIKATVSAGGIKFLLYQYRTILPVNAWVHKWNHEWNAEGGPGKQEIIMTTGVGPGNISRWKLIFSQSLSLRNADILEGKENYSKTITQVTLGNAQITPVAHACIGEWHFQVTAAHSLVKWRLFKFLYKCFALVCTRMNVWFDLQKIRRLDNHNPIGIYC